MNYIDKSLLIRARRSNNKLLSSLLSVLLSASIVMSLFSSSTLASVDVSTGGAPAQPAATGSYSVSAADSTSYVDPVNTFHDESPTYYLVTQSIDHALWTSVTYDGVFCPLKPGNIIFLPAVNGKADIPAAITSIFAANTTIFFDTGTYNDTAFGTTDRFSKPNLSMVGLYKSDDANREPTAKITKSTGTGGTLTRNVVAEKNIYYENLIFDGQNKNMLSNGQGYTAFSVSGGNGLVHSASGGFVMKDCIIQNYGATTIGTNKNVAIMFYQSAGQHNIDKLKIRYMKTQLTYSVIQFNQSTGNYLKDLSIGGNSLATAIKIESTVPNIFTANQIANFFTGSLNLTPAGSFSRIYIQDYGYSTVLPDAFRYVQYSTSNGNNNKQAAYVSASLPPVTSGTAVWDRRDNYWIVRSGASGASGAPQTVNEFDYIKSVLVNAAAAGGVVPTANIKLIASTGGLLDSFDVPDFEGIDVNIVAVAAASEPYSRTVMIPLAAGAVITLPETNYDKVRLYNINFHQNANYTLQEAVSGIPLVAPAAKVTRSSFDTFVNCRFTSLAKEIEVTNVINKIGVGSNAAFAARLTDSDTNSYTGSGIIPGLKDTADDTTINWINWSSSNPLIVSIDTFTGEATALAAGTVTITAKAVDKYNDGEIEKPSDTFSLQAALPYTVTYSDNGSSGGSLTSASNNYLDGDTTLVLDKDTLFKDGYKFIGWNTKQDGSGILYHTGVVLAISNNMAFFAQWELIPSTPTPGPTVSPTPSVTPDPAISPTPSVAPDPTASPTPSVAPDSSVTPAPIVTPEVTATPEPSVTPAAPPEATTAPTTASPTPSATPEPSDTPAAPPTSTPAPTAAPTPATGVLGTDRGLTDTASPTPSPTTAATVASAPTSTLTVAAAPTTSPASHVLSAVTKTGEKADPVLIIGALSILLSGGVLAWLVIRNRKKDR